MYQNSYHSNNRRSNSPQQGRGNSRGNFSRSRNQRKIKVLHPSLFVKKALPTVIEEDFHTTVSFLDLPLIDKLKRNITEHGYVTQTLIQEKSIPATLEGRDVIGIANTGTGKTAAFLIPLINKAALDKSERVLIVTPTRELAMQILDELKVFTRGLELDAVLCIGGANMKRQEMNLAHSPHFVIGTPGRLRDLIERNRINLQLFKNVVLDEVDRMVDIGFINDITYFISRLPKKRQSLFFSATFTPKVEQILRTFVTDPVTVSVKQQETAENVDQDVIRVTSYNKVDVLHDLLIKEGFEKVMVFGRTKWGIEKLTNALKDRGFKASSIHGNKSQGQRQRALDDFKKGYVQVLLATDVASRGLDIENVTHVINFDPPESYDDYVHRIGRTGRAGKKGFALTFVE